jgi:O-antigen ligase
VVALVLLVLTVPGITERYVDVVKNDLNPEYEGGRIFIWNNSLKIIEENPVFGVGQGNFYDVYRTYLRPDVPDCRRLTHAHNDMLNVAAISGVPGMVFFEAMWIAVFVSLWRSYRRPGLTEKQRRLVLAALMGSLLFWMGSQIEATFADEEVRQLLMFVWAAGLSVSYKPGMEFTEGSK